MQHSHSVQSDPDVPAIILCIVVQDFEVIETGLCPAGGRCSLLNQMLLCLHMTACAYD